MDRSVKIPFIVTIIVYAILLVVLIVVCQKHPERPLSNDIITTSKECPYIFKDALGFNSPKSWTNRVWEDIKEQCDNYSSTIIELIKKEMNNPTLSSSDNW